VIDSLEFSQSSIQCLELSGLGFVPMLEEEGGGIDIRKVQSKGNMTGW